MSTLVSLPSTSVGLGLRPVHYADACGDLARTVDYYEVIADNFLGDAETPRGWLERLRRDKPIVLHGVGLNLLGHEPLDETYLARLRDLADWLEAPYVTDHLCWTGSHGLRHHDLLPLPHTEDLVVMAAARARHVQERLRRPFGLENLSSYISFRTSTLSEWDFYSRVVAESGCYAMLDINNVYVSCHNHGWDAIQYLSGVNFDRVLQVHLAGHEELASGGLVDTHNRAVSSPVWDLYRYVWEAHGPFPTLLEWDDSIPSFETLVTELNRAKVVRGDMVPADMVPAKVVRA